MLMLIRFHQMLCDFPLHFKLTLAMAFSGLVILADAATELKGWEDVGLKGLLLFAVGYLIRKLEAGQTKHEQDLKDRDAKTLDVILHHTDALRELTVLTKEQTDYFKAVTRDVVNERLKEH